MKVICPTCSQEISVEDINIKTDLAKCAQCNSLFKASDLIEEINKSIIEKTFADQPPLGSSLKVASASPSSLLIHLPAKGFKGGHIFLAGFTTFWLGFVAFWTWGASQGSIFFALFSIPFWLVGFAMAISLLNGIKSEQIIKVSSNSLTLSKKRPILGKTYTFNVKEIDGVKMENVMITPFNMMNFSSSISSQKGAKNNWHNTPTIFVGPKKYYFFENALPDEQEWVVFIVNKSLSEIKKRYTL